MIRLMSIKSKRGFSFAEVILAIAIMTFALVGILGTYLTCIALISTSQNVNAATNAATGVISEIRSTPFTQVIDDFNGMTFTVNGIPSSLGVVSIDDSVNPELLEVTVDVSWQQGGNATNSAIQLKTQVANR